MKKELNWKDIGRFISILLNLFAIIRDTFTTQGVGLDIIGWVTGEGKDTFIEKFLTPLGEAYLASQCFKLACGEPFFLAGFIGEGWTVWRGSADGDGLKGVEDRDTREDNLSVIDWEKVILETHLQGDETHITGEEKLKRAIASGNIQLGDRAFLSLWEDYQANRENSILEKLRRKGVTRIYFFGLRLRHPHGDRCVLYLYFSGGEWQWRYGWLGNQWFADFPSASVASNK